MPLGKLCDLKCFWENSVGNLINSTQLRIVVFSESFSCGQRCMVITRGERNSPFLIDVFLKRPLPSDGEGHPYSTVKLHAELCFQISPKFWDNFLRPLSNFSICCTEKMTLTFSEFCSQRQRKRPQCNWICGVTRPNRGDSITADSRAKALWIYPDIAARNDFY